MTLRYAALSAELYNRPHMIHPGKLEAIESVFRGYAAGNPPNIDAAIQYRAEAADSPRRPYKLTTGGVAEIPILGTLRNRTSGMAAYSGMTGYQRLATTIDAALSDPDVSAIMLDVDSPGGGVAGLYQFTDKIRSAAQIKPIWAHANESMHSAAYAIGAATGRIIAARSSNVGSIGVIAMVTDQTKFDASLGVKYHTVFAGARKNDFNPHEKINPAALEKLQAEIDSLYELFTEHVATGRQKMTTADVVATEAGTFPAPAAREIGLIDAIANYDDAVAELEQYATQSSGAILAASPTPTPTGNTMSDDKQSDAVYTQADIDAAVQAAEKTAQETGATTERERIAAILNSNEAAGRLAQAVTIATTTDLSADQATALLASMPVSDQPAQVATSQFDALMSKLNPDVGADTDAADAPQDDYAAGQQAAARLLGIN